MSHSAKLKRKAQWQEHQPCRRTELPTQSLLKPLLGSRVEHLGLAWAVREVAQGWWDGLMEAELSAGAEHWGHWLLCHPLGSGRDWSKNLPPASGHIHVDLPGMGRRSIPWGEGCCACPCPVEGLTKLPPKKQLQISSGCKSMWLTAPCIALAPLVDSPDLSCQHPGAE